MWEKKWKKRKNRLEFCFASKQKLLNRSEAKNLKRKKAKKAKKAKKMRKSAKNSKKKWKKRKKRLEIRFALFRFEAKITQVKRSEKFEAKISEKKRKKRSEIL
jgi:hypothetical protein